MGASNLKKKLHIVGTFLWTSFCCYFCSCYCFFSLLFYWFIFFGSVLFCCCCFFWKTLVNFSVRFKQGEVTRRMMKVLIPSSSDQPHLKPDESKQIVLIMKLLLQRWPVRFSIKNFSLGEMVTVINRHSSLLPLSEAISRFS